MGLFALNVRVTIRRINETIRTKVVLTVHVQVWIIFALSNPTILDYLHLECTDESFVSINSLDL